MYNSQEKFKIESNMQILTVGEVLAFELDKSVTNDVESGYQDVESPERHQSKPDRIYLIDGQLNLLRYEVVGKECKKISEVSLSTYSNI